METTNKLPEEVGTGIEANNFCNEDLAAFRKQYPSIDSGDMQTFVLAWKMGYNRNTAENERLLSLNRELVEALQYMINITEPTAKPTKKEMHATREHAISIIINIGK